MNELFTEIQNAAHVIAEPNWADIVAVIVSAIALIVAGIAAHGQKKISNAQVKISEQQTKISLFDLRYDMHDHIASCYMFAVTVVKTAKKSEDIYDLYYSIIKNAAFIRDDDSNNIFIISEMGDHIAKLGKTKFLFSYEIGTAADKLFDALFTMIQKCLLLKEDYLVESISELQIVIAYFQDNNIFGRMASELSLVSLENGQLEKEL